MGKTTQTSTVHKTTSTVEKMDILFLFLTGQQQTPPTAQTYGAVNFS